MMPSLDRESPQYNLRSAIELPIITVIPVYIKGSNGSSKLCLSRVKTSMIVLLDISHLNGLRIKENVLPCGSINFSYFIK